MYNVTVNSLTLKEILSQIEEAYIETFDYFKKQNSLTSCDFILYSDNDQYINTFNFYDNYTEHNKPTRKELLEIKGYSNRKLINECLAKEIVNLNDISQHLLADTENSKNVTIAFRFFKNNFKVKEHTHPPCIIFCYMARGSGDLYVENNHFKLLIDNHTTFRGDFKHSYNSIGESVLLLIQLKPMNMLIFNSYR